jgi:molybdenum cofactor cytidylyltransferase
MSIRGWSLVEAFGLDRPGQLVAIAGGGGKSSLMFALAGQLPGQVVMTTTTRLFASQMKAAPAALIASRPDVSQWPELTDCLARHGRCLVIGPIRGEKATGVAVDLPGRLLARSDVDYVLVEADGSRMRPVKAPAGHEPVIPPETSLVVPAAGIDALDGPIEAVAHRPQLVAALTGLGEKDRLAPQSLARLLTDPAGGLKAAPDRARVIPFLNKVEREDQWTAARRTAQHILECRRVERVVLGALRQSGSAVEAPNRVTAVVLAAGESTRMGQTKQIMPWGETTVLGQTLTTARTSLVHDVLVVTGYQGQAVAQIVQDAGLKTVHNPGYTTGMLSSLQAAVGALPENRAAILVVLADQPMLAPATIDEILIAYWRGRGSLVAPQYQGRRGNPVLIDRRHFDELLALPADAAPKALLQRHPEALHLAPVDDPAVLRDLDEPQDYQRWRPV